MDNDEDEYIIFYPVSRFIILFGKMVLTNILSTNVIMHIVNNCLVLLYNLIYARNRLDVLRCS